MTRTAGEDEEEELEEASAAEQCYLSACTLHIFLYDSSMAVTQTTHFSALRLRLRSRFFSIRTYSDTTLWSRAQNFLRRA